LPTEKGKPAITTLDDLFGIPATDETVQSIPANLIDDFPDHPFHIRKDEAMTAMVESVQAVGIQTPLIVRPKEDGRYEIISGHRRKFAAAIAGLEALPCIVREMTRDEAIIAMVDANLQREVILPSEKAFSYKMKLDAMSRQGKRTDLTCSPVENKLAGKKSLAIVGEAAGDGKDTVRRFIRLTSLVPSLLQLVDEGKIAMRPAVELSYLQETEQADLLEAIESEDCTPSHVQAAKMRSYSEAGRLNVDVVLSIMQEAKPNQVEQFKMPKARISQFFAPGTPAQKIEDTIVKALELLQKRERQREAGR